jgi:hypothetical protein
VAGGEVALSDDWGQVVPLPGEPPPPVPVRRPGRLHGLAIFGMALFAVAGSLATLAFITVTWPGRVGHYLVAVVLASVIGFLACASAAVLTAARDTYARAPSTDRERAE